MRNVPPECKLKNSSTLQYQSFWWLGLHLHWNFEVDDEASPEVPAQEVPAPAPTSPEVFNVTVPESVAGQILKFPRPDGRERQAKDPEGIEF